MNAVAEYAEVYEIYKILVLHHYDTKDARMKFRGEEQAPTTSAEQSELAMTRQVRRYQMGETRRAFLREVSDPAQAREVFIEMVRQARQG